jgi:hypothetical protein
MSPLIVCSNIVPEIVDTGPATVIGPVLLRLIDPVDAPV